MRLILILGLAGAMLCAPMSAFGQSKIKARAKFDIKAEVAFPFKEKQISRLKWEYGKGGEFFGQVIKEHKPAFMCDYSCTITAGLADDAFLYLETREKHSEGEHVVYGAEVNATIKRKGDITGFGNCDYEEEYNQTLFLEVQDFTTEGWIDITLIHGPNWPPCFTGPLSTKVTP